MCVSAKHSKGTDWSIDCKGSIVMEYLIGMHSDLQNSKSVKWQKCQIMGYMLLGFLWNN